MNATQEKGLQEQGLSPLWADPWFLRSSEDELACIPLSQSVSPAFLHYSSLNTVICLASAQAESQADFNDCPQASAKQLFYRCTLFSNSLLIYYLKGAHMPSKEVFWMPQWAC